MNAPVDISPGDLETVREILAEHIPEYEVLAFGSRVAWTARQYSDLDLAVMTEEPLDIMRMADLKEAFAESDLPFRVDIVDWASTSENFRKIIEKECIVVQKEDTINATRKTIVGKFAPFIYGKSLPKKRQVSSGDVPVFGSNGIVGYHDTALTDGPTIIIGRKGTIGKIHYSSVPCWPIDTTFFITDSNIKRLRFKYYMLKSLGLEHMNSDSAVPGLNRDEAHACEIQPHSPKTQYSISHILSTLDDKIELNRKMSETLEAITQALFKSWFIDFDPVRAKMKGLDTVLPQNIAHIFPERFVESEIGKIPEGWKVKPLDKIADFHNGLALQRHRPQGDEDWLPVVKIAQLRSGKAESGEKSTANIQPESIINDGDVVFSWSGTLMVKIWCGGRAALNQHLFKVTSTKFPKWFFMHCIRSHLLGFQTIAAGKATTMGHIRRHHLSEAMCVVPDSQFLAEADGLLSLLLEKSISLHVQSRTVSAIRDALLPRLISGRLRVKDAEAFLEGVL